MIAAFVFSGYLLVNYFAEGQTQSAKYDAIREQIEPTPSAVSAAASGASTPANASRASSGPTAYEKYEKLFAQNSDMVGWIKIDGTPVDYPVMQTDNNSFYLTHDFNKKYSLYGVPFVDAACRLNPQSDNVIIYGHHMKNGQMFGALVNYAQKGYYLAHPVIEFDTRYGYGQYKIIAVFHTTPDKFPYHEFISAENAAALDTFIGRCKAFQYYDTGVTAVYGDKLLTLSTCEYSEPDGRLVIVAKKIR